MTGLECVLRRTAMLFSLTLIGMACGAISADGQCCGGAYDSVAHSHGGRFRVEATSLTGTGHSSHGPYKFRFRTLRTDPNGKTELVGVFDRFWDNDHHFSMTVCVSPTGNGFALSTSLEKSILFFSPDGTVLAEIGGYTSAAIKHCKTNDSIVRTVYGRTQHGFRHTELWLPLFHITGPETGSAVNGRPVITENIGFKTVQPEEIRWLQRMLTWRPSLGQREAGRVQKLIDEADEMGLVEIGLSALPQLDAKLDTGLVKEELLPLRRAQQEIVRRLCGHRDAWRNLDLLIALCEHPDQSLQECAQNQLQVMLPEGEPTFEWIRQNRDQLKWDTELNVYRPVRK